MSTLEAIKSERRAIEFGDIVARQIIAMQAALLAGELLGPEHCMQWLRNALRGPGFIPDAEEAKAMGGAQAWLDTKLAANDTFRAEHPGPGLEDARPAADDLRGLDTPTRVRFYEHDFYVLSNFSAFRLTWRGIVFDTSEAAYHWEKFPHEPMLRGRIISAPSAHEAFKIAEASKAFRRHDWDKVKVDVMREILRTKAQQHEYVRRKLLATDDRELVEDSWRDDFWGWGPNRDGKNMLGRLWMEVRAELRAAAA